MIRKDIKKFINTIPKSVTLVAATKYANLDDMSELFASGIFNFGENRVDSFLSKYNALSNLPITWHFIGHLQTNKAKNVISKIDYLHSLDSLKLAKIIDDNRTTPLKCFLEISINEEETKNGIRIKDLKTFVDGIIHYKNIEIVGLMMMAVKDSDHDSLIKQFTLLRDIKNLLQESYKIKIPYLSMGMSDDYMEAIECGATHIRLGRILYKQ